MFFSVVYDLIKGHVDVSLFVSTLQTDYLFNESYAKISSFVLSLFGECLYVSELVTQSRAGMFSFCAMIPAETRLSACALNHTRAHTHAHLSHESQIICQSTDKDHQADLFILISCLL